MLIVGAKGFAKEIVEVIIRNNPEEEIVFYDDVSNDLPDLLFNKFRIIRDIDEARDYFQTHNPSFCLGVGNPEIRKMMYCKMISIGGKLISMVSNDLYIGSFDNYLQDGVTIMPRVVITNSVTVNEGTLINQLSSIGHDVTIGSFVEICPSVSISGNCKIGDNTFIGTGAIVLPKVQIGNNVTIGAGAVVTQNIPDNAVAVGMPAKIIKYNNG